MGASVSEEDTVSTTARISSDQGLGVKAAEPPESVAPSLEPSVVSSLESGDGEPAASGVSPALNVQDVLKELEESIQETEAELEDVHPESYSKENLKSKPRLNCIPVNRSSINQVIIVNGTELQLKLTEENDPTVANRTFPGSCSVTLFYASWCPFSAQAAPFYNAVPALFPGINFYAIDSSNSQNIYTQYGVIALPTMLVFHNSRQLYRYNHSEHTLDKYNEFLSHLTGIQPLNISMQIEDTHKQGPVPSTMVRPFNYNLVLASLFLLACALLELSKSAYFQTAIENLRNAWRDAEIQHEHTD